MITVARDLDATPMSSSCRQLIDVDWDNVCATRVEPSRHMHSSCGIHVDLEGMGFIHPGEFSAMVLYDFSDFEELADIGFANAVDRIVPTDDREERILGNFQANFKDMSFEFHRCEIGNFIHVEGNFEWP